MASTQKRSLGQKLSNAWQNSFFVTYFTNYQAFDFAMNQNRFQRIFAKFMSLGFWKWTRRKIQSNVERSRFVHWIDAMMRALLHLPLKTYGMFFLSFGLYLASMCYILPNTYMQQSNFSNLIIAIASVLIAFILLTSKKSLASAVWESKIFSSFFFSLLGVRSNTVDEDITINGSDALAFLFGMLFGVLTFIVPATTLLGAFTVFFLAYLVLLTPESGLILLLLILPFVDTSFLFFALLFVLFAYLLKLLQSRRMLHIRGIDYTVLFFTIYLAISGSISATPSSSAPHAIFYATLAIGYFLVISLVKTAIWLRRCVFALTFSAFFIAAYGILEYFFGDLSTAWQDQTLFSALRGRAVATFENPNLLAEYLILIIPIALAMFIIQVSQKKKLILSLPLLIALVGCLICTWSRGAWIGIVIGLAFFCICSGKVPRRIFFLCVAAIAIAWRWLPANFTARVISILNLSDSSNAYRIQIWRSSWEMIQSVWYSGIGWGEEIFSQYYASFSHAGAPTAAHAHQLFLQLWISLGVIGLLAFLYILLLLLRYFISLHTQLKHAKETQTYYYSIAFLSSIIALLCHGLTDYVFYQGRIFFLFFCMCGLLIMSGRTYYRERNLAKTDSLSIELPYVEEGSHHAKKI